MEQTVIFYDGNCVVCDLEMSHYKRQEKAGLLKFVDIHSDEFKQYAQELSFQQANARMHVMKNGKKLDGVDAFLLIWEALPQKRYKFLSKLIQLKYVRPVADVAYDIFAKYRKYLPKKRKMPI